MYIKPLLLILSVSIFICSCQEERQVKVIAHRGGAKLAPENTLTAFQKAIDLGVEMIEIDIEQTSDSVVVVIHDRHIDRTTNGEGAVDSLTYEQIKDLDAGSWFDEKYSNEKIPTLDEVFEFVNDQTILLIEIKSGSERYPGIERRTVEAINKHNAKSWSVVQSFNLKAVERIKALDPDIETYYLLGRGFKEYFEQHFGTNKTTKDVNLGFEGFAVNHRALDAEAIEVLKAHGLSVFTWTVNDPDEMDRFLETSIDGIITDAPDVLIEKLQ